MSLLFVSNCCFGQEADSASPKNPELKFLDKRIIDYGHIKSKDVINIDGSPAKFRGRLPENCA